jgi:hypothetical protein
LVVLDAQRKEWNFLFKRMGIITIDEGNKKEEKDISQRGKKKGGKERKVGMRVGEASLIRIEGCDGLE